MNTQSITHRLRLACAGAVISLAAIGPVSANQVFTTDCAFDFKDDYGSDEAVCASGDVDTKPSGFAIFPEGDVCVVAAGNLSAGGGIGDVTAGGCNTVVGSSLGGGFFDEFIWLPPLTPGLFQVVLDENQNGVFDGPDVTGNFFRVGDPVGASVNVAAIKGVANTQFEKWDTLARHWHWVSDANSVLGIAAAAATGNPVGVAVGVAGVIFGFPTDYNSGVLDIGGKVIAATAAQQARKYEDLKNDPPDFDYTEFVALDFAQLNAELAAETDLYPGVGLVYPFTTLGSSPFEAAQIALANQAAVQATLVRALTLTLEKFQGAELSGDDLYLIQQARQLQEYADQLVGNLAETRQALEDYLNEQTNEGLDEAIYSAAEIEALVTRLETTGLEPAEIANLQAAGFLPADIATLLTRVSAFADELPAADFTRRQTLTELIDIVEVGIDGFQALSVEAGAVIADRSPFVLPQFPFADAGGPYLGDQGATIPLDGSGSTDPNGDALTYEWDFDLDGNFDDAIGETVDYLSDLAGKTLVGLRVTDPSGNADIDYAELTIQAVNLPPEIDAFSPLTLEPTASPAAPLAFSVDASDPDGDPLSYQWTLDGIPVSAAQTYDFQPLAGESGIRIVKVRVSDGNALTPDALEQRIVTIEAAPPVLIVVPPVIGGTQADAEAALVAVGLVVGNVSTSNSELVPAGLVISQDPAAGTEVAPGSAVDLVVSLGPEPVPVPPVTGGTQADAEAALVAVGLVVGNVTTSNSELIPAGLVISQDPAAGTEVAPGSAVDLVVSLGPLAVSRCDVDGDGDTDKVDLNLISRSRNQPASGADDPRDADGDGQITIVDVKTCIPVCTLAGCAIP